MDLKYIRDELEKRIEELITPIIARNNAYLVDVKLQGMGRRKLLRIYVDTYSGITLDECTLISRELSKLLDKYNIIEGSYNLEVSSPGIDRPLTEKRDFAKNIGREVELYHDDLSVKSPISGKILKVDENFLELEEKKEILKLKLNKVIKGKVKIKF